MLEYELAVDISTSMDSALREVLRIATEGYQLIVRRGWSQRERRVAHREDTSECGESKS